jgi:thioredoxin 1
MAPIFEELAKELSDVTFAKVNVDEAPDLAMRFNVLSIPTFVVLKGGTEIGRFSGAMPKEMVKERLAAIIQG